MIGTRYEDYSHCSNLPFVLHIDIVRTPFKLSKEKNWHEDLEIELCTDGNGTVLLNGSKYDFNKNDIIAVGSNVIHYTGTETSLTYTCLIISAAFCRQMGIEYDKLQFSPLIKSERLLSLMNTLKITYQNLSLPCRTAKLNGLVLKILIELAENHSVKADIPISKNKAFTNVKTTIKYIRENYHRKITLDELAKVIYTDKYALCRDFKKTAGQTIVEYTNNYRCLKAADYLTEGYTAAEAAVKCGFGNLSFFTKTFKKYMGVLPSKYSQQKILPPQGRE